MSFKFTSESVSEGHPDKLCDQISDAILEQIARQKAIEIGYDAPEKGLDGANCRFQQNVQEQSPDIAQGVDTGAGKYKKQGAGDQGIMFGYACKQTESLMPLPIQLSHELMQKIQELRHNNTLSYLRPDAKSQVTVHYENNVAKYVDTVVISTQHSPDIDATELEQDIINLVIKPIIPENLLSNQTRYLINPTGRFVEGGPAVDTGLTGRKIIVDTYGGWASHGGGAFSGKDPSKVDRSAAYMARYVAKNIVASGLAEECLLQLSYAIGYPEPVSLYIDTKNTSALSDAELDALIRENFDLTPAGIVETLNLKSPIFAESAALGHFGRNSFSWEQTDKVDVLKKAAEKVVVVS